MIEVGHIQPYHLDEDGKKVQSLDTSTASIEEQNMGHKLLKLMGWSGGGLGKGGQGISVPIRAADFNSRQGKNNVFIQHKLFLSEMIYFKIKRLPLI